MVGKQVVLVANLKPRKIFGLESHGMLLCAEDKKQGFAFNSAGCAGCYRFEVG